MGAQCVYIDFEMRAFAKYPFFRATDFCLKTELSAAST
jgi:hypothetical protein